MVRIAESRAKALERAAPCTLKLTSRVSIQNRFGLLGHWGLFDVTSFKEQFDEQEAIDSFRRRQSTPFEVS